MTSRSKSSRRRVSALWDRICLTPLPTRLNRDNRRPAHLAFSVSPSQLREVREY